MTFFNHCIRTFTRHASIGRSPTRHSGAVPRRDRHPGNIRNAPAPGGSSTPTRHTTTPHPSFRNFTKRSVVKYPESPSLLPYTVSLPSRLASLKQGIPDSTLSYRTCASVPRRPE